MADELPAPDWSLLPRRPAQFFGLEPGFERNDLKRAYNRLLRQFKPEKFPEEFQKIRAAYETLDEQLRYGTVLPDLPAAPVWHTDAEAAPRQSTSSNRGEADTAAPLHRAPTLAERLAHESPATIYAELQSKLLKTPFDFYSLAVLSDVVDPAADGFAMWLVEGVAAHPREQGLLRLLHEHFRAAPHSPSLGQVLVRLAELVRDDSYYPLCEAGWMTLARELPFDEFRTLLDAALQHIRDVRIAGRVTFVVQLLGVVAWQPGSRRWVNRQIDWLDQHYEHVPPWLGQSIDLLDLVREYLKVREKFRRDDPLRQELDAALAAYFMQPTEVSDPLILDLQHRLLTDAPALLAATKPDSVRSWNEFFRLWYIASGDVASRHGTSEDVEGDANMWERRLEVRLRQVQGARESKLRANGGAIGVGCALVVAVLLAVIGMLSLITSSEWSRDTKNVLFTAIMLSTFVLFPIVFLSVLDRLKSRRLAADVIRFADKWRPELLEFQRTSRLHFRQSMEATVTVLTRLSVSQQNIDLYRRDFATPMLWIAQRFEV